MESGPLVFAAELVELLSAGERRPVVLDVRWELGVGSQRGGYQTGHIPGAVFVDLDTELAAPVSSSGAGGRHPLPRAADFEATMRAAGVRNDRGVVVYDAASAASAARAWWLLRYFGHPDVTVLDGGLAAWTANGGALQIGADQFDREPGDFTARPGGMAVLDAAGAAALAQTGVLLDARAPERFRGDTEPIDTVAGHIPGARNRPTTLNVDDAGRFLGADRLREAFGLEPHASVGAYCGSGVTAAHEVLALELAGYRAALYAGSWSDWISDPERPVATCR